MSVGHLPTTETAVDTDAADRETGRFAYIPPNWFAAVMGTGIIAIGAHGLAWQNSLLRGLALAFWLLACVLYVLVVAATAAHWISYPDTARAHLRHPVIAHFYGAVPMATLTVGTSTLLVGAPLIGHAAAVGIDLVLFGVGTLGGVITAITIPLLHLVGRRESRGDAFGGWLMSVVPPTVSASGAAILAGELASSAAQTVVLTIGYAMLALSLVLSLPIIVAIVARLVTSGVGAAGFVPTWWIVLGPLGQSITAACLLGRTAGDPTLIRFGVDYGVAVWFVALCWIGIAAAITAHTVANGMPFALTWWSFTFPVGTFVTGTNALAVAEDSTPLAVIAVVAFAALLIAWTVVAVRTRCRGARRTATGGTCLTWPVTHGPDPQP